MLYKTHILTGLTIGEVVNLVSPIDTQNLGLYFLIILFSSIIPDIDEPKSVISRMLPAFISKFINEKFGHRGVTHNIAGITVMLSFAFYISFLAESYLFFIAFSIGYLSHILGDAVTYAGINNFFIVSNRKFKVFNHGLLVGSVTEAKLYMLLIWTQVIILYFYS